MEILFYRYGSICEPDILQVFREFGITVTEETTEITNKSIDSDTRIRILAELLLTHQFTFVFSINFFPYISDICEKLHIPYVCWSVDCPVLEFFSKAIHNRCNRIFLFDYTQYQRFHSENPDCIFYLPLATNTARWDEVNAAITEVEKAKYTSDISFIGSLYTEKSPLNSLSFSAYTKGYIEGIIQAQLKVYGYNFLEESVTTELLSTLKAADADYLSIPNPYTDIDSYVAANYYLGMAVSEADRIQTLNELAKYFDVTLYTRSNVDSLHNVICRDGVSTLTEMPKIFRCSKINLNITMRPIQSGLSLRIWDVLGCGGFLLSNYQSEIPEYFELGKDLDCYESLSDLKEKCAFYLAHEDIRQEIAHNGYEKIKQLHTYKHRVAEILRVVTDSIL